MRYHAWLKSEERTDMLYEDDEDFDLIGGAPAPTDEDDVKDEEEEVEEPSNEAEEEDTEEVSDEAEPDEEKVEEKPKDNKTKALSAERARRKEAERKLKELEAKLDAEKVAKENEDKISKEREAYKKKMLEGDLVDEEVADKLLEVFGDDIIKTKIANQARAEAENFDKELSELKKDDLFMDADVYKPQIKEFMSKGLTMEEAYFASLSRARIAQLKKDMEVEIEQKLLNNNEKTSKIDVGHAEAKSEVKKGKYTKREQEIANETGLSVQDVKKRSGMFELEDMLNL